MTPRTAGALALAALLSATVLAGCIGSAAATAMETRSQADAAAERWSPDARLAQVVGVEGSLNLAAIASYMSGAGQYSGGDYERAQSDETIGDGRAEVWGYRYVSPAKPLAYVVLVDREGNILKETEETRGSDFGTPVGEWSVDSDAALAIAKEANEALRSGVTAENFGFVSLLRQDDAAANPTWLIAGGGGSLDGAGGGFVEIDAVTGKVLKSDGGFFTPQDWAGAWG